MKFFADKLNNKIVIHGGSVLFLFATAYNNFFGEFLDGTFLHYYFEKKYENYFFSEHSHQIFNFPFKFWGFWFCLSSFILIIHNNNAILRIIKFFIITHNSVFINF